VTSIDKHNALAALWTTRRLIGLLDGSTVMGPAEYVRWDDVCKELEVAEAVLRAACDQSPLENEDAQSS
jgi:hypothetical protein